MQAYLGVCQESFNFLLYIFHQKFTIHDYLLYLHLTLSYYEDDTPSINTFCLPRDHNIKKEINKKINRATS